MADAISGITNLFSLFQSNTPTGCNGSCAAAIALSGAPLVNTAMGILAGVIGTYGIIEQWKLQKRMLKLAERAADVADDFYDLSKDKYDTVDVPTWDRMRALYDRWAGMSAMEDKFLNCAFALKEYCPDTTAEAARSIGRVNKFYSSANAHRMRLAGRHCTEVACHHSNYAAATMALYKSSAASAGFQYEERRKRQLDQWFWERWQDGAKLVLAMGDRAVKAILGGASVVDGGLRGVGEAVGAVQQAANGVVSAMANSAQFFGNLASGGMNGFGQAIGSGYFSSPAPSAGQWQTSVSSAPSSSWSTSVSGSLKD